jgi:aspartate carbamoyltransferase catalytic subunit
MSDEVEQLNSRGELRHLINLGGLDRAHLEEIIDLATRYLTPVGAPAPRDDILRGRTVANLFFEPSTRTRASFELAAKRLRADVLNLDVNMSSRAKGESIMDTIYTLQAMQVDIFVVRDASTGVPARIAQQVAPHVCVLNAGESDVSHPTQGLLDLMTIQRHKGDVRETCVAIVGDVKHSRVARSAHQALSKFRRRRAAARRAAGAIARRRRVPGREAPDRDRERHPGRRRRDGFARAARALRRARRHTGSAGVRAPLRADRGAFGVGESRRDRDASRTDEPRCRDRRSGGGRPAIGDSRAVTHGLAIRMAVLALIHRHIGHEARV